MEIILVVGTGRAAKGALQFSHNQLVAENVATEEAIHRAQDIGPAVPAVQLAVGCDVVPELIGTTQPLFSAPPPVLVVIARGVEPQFVAHGSSASEFVFAFKRPLLLGVQVRQGGIVRRERSKVRLYIRSNFSLQFIDEQPKTLVLVRAAIPG